MNRIDVLIQQHCPNGVDFIPLGEVCASIKTGKLNANAQEENGKYPFFTCDAEPYRINTYAFDCEAILVTGNGSQVGHINYYNGKFNAYQRTYVLSSFDKSISIFYALHYFKAHLKEYILIKSKKGSVPYITLPMLLDFIIPIPPLPVQEEIVRVLDTFTELQAELQAELQKRLQQYEYYKWSVLESLSCPTKHITDIALIKARVGWQRLTTAEYLSSGNYYLITGTDFKSGQIDFGNCVFVSKERYEMDPNIIVGKGDILITKDGTLGKVAYLADEPDKPTTLNSGVFRIHVTDEKVSPRYLFHYFTSKYFTDFVNSVKTGSTIPHLTQQGLVSLDIPIPSLEEQNRVVSILDRFETLTNDLTSGLPAEIEKRRQQYEYYRDKLLTFKRKEV